MTFRRDLAVQLPRLQTQALRFCVSESDALDLVQDTLLRATRYETSFTPGTNLRAWLLQILRSVFISRYRRRGRERRALEAMALDPCAWPHRDPTPAMESLPVTAARALAALPPHFRNVVELVDLGGLEYRDAAATLGVPVGTVMSRLHRARKLLAERLSDDTRPRAGNRSTPVREAAPRRDTERRPAYGAGCPAEQLATSQARTLQQRAAFAGGRAERRAHASGERRAAERRAA